MCAHSNSNTPKKSFTSFLSLFLIITYLVSFPLFSLGCTFHFSPITIVYFSKYVLKINISNIRIVQVSLHLLFPTGIVICYSFIGISNCTTPYVILSKYLCLYFYEFLMKKDSIFIYKVSY